MSNGYRVSDKVSALMKKGVRIPTPCSVEIGEEIAIERISGRGVILHSGTKLFGDKTLICDDVELGYEAPVTVTDCQLGRGVKLKGGFFQGSVLLDGVQMASSAHVREGCILEEEVRAGHTVGLKQTILFPFVTLGSLINFCDCFMSGGTDNKNHSEVGSSYIHFNYTPNQDKATPSLIGDVPTGVMLNQPPIFLGGQGGLVGPVRIGHGTVIAAGTIYRKDCPEGGRLLAGGNGTAVEKDFDREFYGDVYRKVRNNILYIAHLTALKQWYLNVRNPFFHAGEFGQELSEGALEKLDMAIRERLRRLQEFLEKIGLSAQTRPNIVSLSEALWHRWPQIEICLTEGPEEIAAPEKRDRFLDALHSQGSMKEGYIQAIRSLEENARAAGTAWLQAVIDGIVRRALDAAPLLREE
ncbi:MAG TPA: UDP-N-acetylglucosamine pyrophosphorylase [Syntrophales bacterium]|nr:UDP-N-acetylglucosamine pyrophosphorylase [Syntrophales bacterium]